MTRKKDKEESVDQEISVGDNPEDFDLLEAINQLPSENKAIQIWRMHDQGRPRYLGLLAPYEFNIEHVKETWGGGRYKVSFPLDGARIERVLEIEGPAIVQDSKTSYWGRNAGLDKPPAILQGGDPVQTQILQTLLELKQALTHKDDSQTTQILLQALLQRDRGEDKVLENMMKYRALFAPSSGTMDANTILGALKTGLELGGEGAGLVESKNPWLALGEKILPLVAQALTKINTPMVPSDPVDNGHLPPEVLQNNGATPMIDQAPKTGFAAIAPELQGYLPTFVNAAARNADPSNLAELTLSMLPEQSKSHVTEWLSSEKWFSDLCTLSPLIAAQQAWWFELRAVLLDMIQQPQPVDDEKD